MSTTGTSTSTVSSSTATIVPSMRRQDILFFSKGIKPDKQAHYFFDGVNVDNFTQRASVLVANSSSGFDASVLNEGVGLYCHDTKAYASVIGVSETYPDYRIYIKENYISLNIAAFGANTITATDYRVGDIVSSNRYYYYYNYLQTTNGFIGKVEYFNSADGLLVISPVYGTPVSASGANTIFNIWNGKSVYVSDVVVNSRFPKTSIITTTSGSSYTFKANSYLHHHGIVPKLSGDTAHINLLCTSPDLATGNNIYITSGTGFANSNLILSVSGTGNAALAFTSSQGRLYNLSGTSHYSIGNHYADDIGAIGGVFSIPEDTNYNFKVGTKIFTITDSTTLNDPASQMTATGQFVAHGWVFNNYKYSPYVSPYLPTSNSSNQFVAVPTADQRSGKHSSYLAQTFYTPQPTSASNSDSGIFVTSVNLFFYKKPNVSAGDIALPVTIRLVSTDNGYPTENILAESTVAHRSVQVTDGLTTYPSSNDPTTYTNFPFPDPVYLSSGQEYAIVVHSDSPSYEVWISQIGETVVGDANFARVSNQPYAGSFFISQNASKWTSYENQDLMFMVNKAVFDSSVYPSLVFNVDSPKNNQLIDAMWLNSSDVTFGGSNVQYAFKSTVYNNGSPYQDSEYTPIQTESLYNFSSDLKTSSTSSSKERIINAGDANSMFISVTMYSSNPDVTPIFNTERLSLVTQNYIINNCELSSNCISITNPGNHSNAANITVTIGPSQLYPTLSSAQATANVLPSGLNSANLVTINITNAGAGYIQSPTITITEPGRSSNAAAIVASEDGKSGGNALARYQTKVITLADGFDAGDLRVYVDGVIPQGTNVLAYYKVLSASDTDTVNNKNWKLMNQISGINSPDTQTQTEFVYQPKPSSANTVYNGTLSYTENGISYPLGGTFKYFQIKLVMLAEDPSVPPLLNSIRAIALPGEK